MRLSAASLGPSPFLRCSYIKHRRNGEGYGALGRAAAVPLYAEAPRTERGMMRKPLAARRARERGRESPCG